MAKAQAQKVFAARLGGRDPAEEKKQSRRRPVVDRVDELVETFWRARRESRHHSANNQSPEARRYSLLGRKVLMRSGSATSVIS
jgi:hypothetical protein